MQCAAFANGWLDRDRTILETMMAFRRAGADAVLTYLPRTLPNFFINSAKYTTAIRVR